MRKLLISDPSGLMGILTLIVAVPTTGLGVVGATVGFKKWWGFLLAVPAFLLGVFACFMLGRFVLLGIDVNARTLIDLGGLSLAILIAALLGWRWLAD